jgi:hypothetical protein
VTYELLAYFVAGIAIDVMITFYYIKITELAIWTSGFMSTCITLFQVLVLWQILLSPDALDRTIAYAVGCGLGTSAVVYWKKHEQTRNRFTQRRQST